MLTVDDTWCSADWETLKPNDDIGSGCTYGGHRLPTTDWAVDDNGWQLMSVDGGSSKRSGG